MSDSTEQPGGGGAPRDPWAPPESRAPLPENKVPLEKPSADAAAPAARQQPTVAAMPGAEESPAPADAPPSPGFGAPAQSGQAQSAPVQSGPVPGVGDVPPPPVGPNGPGQQSPPPAGPYGYPAAPPAPYGGYSSYPGYGQTSWVTPPANGMGIAAMVLGILAVCLFCVYGIPSLVLGTLALIFGILGRKRAQRGEANNGGQALAGIILGSIGIVFGVAIISFFIWLFATQINEIEDDSTYDDPYATSLVVDVRR